MYLQIRVSVVTIIFLCSILLGMYVLQNEITKEMITESEKILGLSFTDVEKDSMIDALKQQLAAYEKIRKVKLDNSIPPAIIFNPIPVGFSFPKGENEIRLSDYSKTKLPANRDELAFYSIGELGALLRSKQITSVELTQFFLARLKKYNPALQAVITFTDDLALRQAKAADDELKNGKDRGPLQGIPFGIKDLLSTKNYKTTWGSVPFKDQLINNNAAVVKKLEDAGAVLCAKLTMGELAWGDIWFGGVTKNPWDTTQGSSGSSAGPASVVSAGLLPFAIGTETWGSIVSPSTVCGVTGLRPTYGRVSRDGAMALSWSMDKIGPICRNAEDCAIVFSVLNGQGGTDQTVFDLPFSYSSKVDITKLKVGYLKYDFDSSYDFRTNDSLMLETYKKLGVNLIPIELPDLPVNELQLILWVESAAAFDELTRSNKDDMMVMQIKEAWPNYFRASRFVPAVEYINANRIRYLLIQSMLRIFNKVDLFLAPSWQGDNLLLTNLTGHPCITVPNGFNKDGTLSSFTIIGNLFDEGTIISAAKFFQDNTDYHRKHPKL